MVCSFQNPLFLAASTLVLFCPSPIQAWLDRANVSYAEGTLGALLTRNSNFDLVPMFMPVTFFVTGLLWISWSVVVVVVVVVAVAVADGEHHSHIDVHDVHMK